MEYKELTKARSTDSQSDVRKRLQDTLELLAEAEHEGWAIAQITEGWRSGSPYTPDGKDIENRIHGYLVPYAQLDEDIKNYDRYTIIGHIPSAAETRKGASEQFGYVDIVKTAGFRVEFAHHVKKS